jgi:hypothetical protein
MEQNPGGAAPGPIEAATRTRIRVIMRQTPSHDLQRCIDAAIAAGDFATAVGWAREQDRRKSEVSQRLGYRP